MESKPPTTAAGPPHLIRSVDDIYSSPRRTFRTRA
jgi:hypothetical protein